MAAGFYQRHGSLFLQEYAAKRTVHREVEAMPPPPMLAIMIAFRIARYAKGFAAGEGLETERIVPPIAQTLNGLFDRPRKMQDEHLRSGKYSSPEGETPGIGRVAKQQRTLFEIVARGVVPRRRKHEWGFLQRPSSL
jgi:hypothetical protein